MPVTLTDLERRLLALAGELSSSARPADFARRAGCRYEAARDGLRRLASLGHLARAKAPAPDEAPFEVDLAAWAAIRAAKAARGEGCPVRTHRVGVAVHARHRGPWR
jgi:hypothetical protein